MRFTKLQALGNDFICLDCTERPLPADPDRLAVAMASRRLGVGADGLLCVLPGGEGRLRMVLYNADGSRAAMCGNGLRCLAAYAWAHGLAEAGAPLVVETDAGPRTLTAVPGGIRADMGRPVLEPSLRLEAAGRTWRVTPVSMGNPHAVLFVPRLEDIALEELGPAAARHPPLPRPDQCGGGGGGLARAAAAAGVGAGLRGDRGLRHRRLRRLCRRRPLRPGLPPVPGGAARRRSGPLLAGGGGAHLSGRPRVRRL